MTAPKSLSAALRAAVTASGLTPYAISRASGVSQSVLSRWLRGERDVTLGTADRIAAAVGLEIPAKRNPKILAE